MAESISGRTNERSILDGLLRSKEPEFLAIYGRRRVGKTFLIRQHVGPQSSVFFEVAGQKDAPMRTQIANFQSELEKVFFDGARLPPISNWDEAFRQLASAVERTRKKRKTGCISIFLDELPWLATKRSGLIPALDYLWNQRLSRVPNVLLVVCGSAAAWMLDKLIHAKGGLYNRLTKRVALSPFSLAEADAFLRSTRGIRYKPMQLLELYMALGGIPAYLRHAEQGRSAAENVARICLHRSGALFDEFEHLFPALFDSSEVHDQIIRAMVKKRKGLTRSELADASSVSSGGGLARALRELEEACFVDRTEPFGAKRKQTLFRLSDEYSWFYLSWISKAPKSAVSTPTSAVRYWTTQSSKQSFRSWAGYAFESLCIKHSAELVRSLEIDGVVSNAGSWRYSPRGGKEEGAQIDLVLDREDGAINLCEMKFSSSPFEITRRYASELKYKLEAFERVTKSKKQLILTFVAPLGLKENAWSNGLIDRALDVSALFVR